MSDSHSTVTNQSWFSRIKESFAGILVGLLLFIAAFPVLFLNEGRAVNTARGLEEGAGAVVSVVPDTIDKAMDKKLVHFTGDATTVEELNDASFNVTINAVALRRSAEMYQWEEKKKSETKDKLGGGQETTTTYSYQKNWSKNVIKSTEFNNPNGHTNPTTMPFGDKITRASLVTVGAYKLPPTLISKMDDFQPLAITNAMYKAMPDDILAKSKLNDQFLYIGDNPQSPQIGDTRISFQIVKPGPVSVVARQVGNTLEPYTTKAKTQLEFLYNGTHSAESMFSSEISANTTLTWILRGLGVFLMFFGIMLILKPFSVLASVIPFLGRILAFGTTFIAGAISIPLSLTTIAIGWIVYRPLLGILLLIVAIGIAVGTTLLLKARAQKKANATT